MSLRRNSLVVSGLFLLLSWPSNAQEDDSASLPDLTEIRAKLVEIRGLEFKRDVPAESQSVEDFRAYITKDLETTYPPEAFADMMDGLLRLGILKEKIDLGDAFVNAILTQAAAYYDPMTGTFYYLMTDMPEDVLKVFAAHELVHALQDQHYGLKPIMEEFATPPEGEPRNDDFIHAVRFLIEGEATYVMNLFQYGPQADQMTTMMGAMDMEQVLQMSKMAAGMADMGEDMIDAIKAMDEIPRYILTPLYAAYMQGAAFTVKVRQQGGWERVAGVWADLPLSTEQVLHAEKYLEERDVPTTLRIPDIADLASQGWKPIDAAIHGEMLLNLLLREQKVGGRIADGATAGWDGDVYQAWRHEDGRVMIALATTWDTERDATQFFNAYKTALKSKYLGFEPEVETDDDTLTFSCGEPLGRGMMVRRGQEVFIVEGGGDELHQTVIRELTSQAIARDNAVSPMGGASSHVVRADGLRCDVQQGWVIEAPSSDARIAQFKLPRADGDAEDASLVVFYFEGHGGDVQANMDRWIGQFDDASEPTINSTTVNGLAINTIDVSGTYVAETFPGSGDRVNKPGWRMLAAIVQSEVGPYYFKLVGPEKTVARWTASWEKCLADLRPE